VEIKRKVMSENQRQPKPPVWEKLKPKARQMRHAPTKAEQLLWQKLRSRQVNGFKFRRQHVIDRFNKLYSQPISPLHEMERGRG